jgi:hypothetical protein
MIGQLPKKLTVNGVEYSIRSDYRIILHIFSAYNDPEVLDMEKAEVMLKCLYEEFEKIPDVDYQEAHDQAIWFLEGGKSAKQTNNDKKLLDWEQDEHLIFPAINKVAGYEIREKEYLHWWTALGFFNEIGDGLFTTVLSIRQKKAKGRKLEKHEQEFYKQNQDLICLKEKYSEEVKEKIDYYNNLLG